MKKIFALITAAVLSVNALCFAVQADEFKEFVCENGKVTGYYGGECVYIPSEIDQTAVKEIGDKAFFDLGIKMLWIENGIEKIGESAFEGSNLIDVTIPSTAAAIGSRAFANCDALAIVALNNDAVELGNEAFAGTGHIVFNVPCKSDKETLKKKISAAKGDDDFEFSDIHMSLSESMEEKDIYGESMIYCDDCGLKESRYYAKSPLNFEDVSEDAWYYEYVSSACGIGILNGKSDTTFDPNEGLTCAEAAKIAACINANQNGIENAFETTGENWYDTYVDYCYKNGIIEDYIIFDWNKNATRAQVAYLLSRCDALPHYVNEVPLTDIPDVGDTTPFAYEILDLYNKGIAVGSNEYYSFYPDAEVKRSEAAALIVRMYRLNMRIELPKG